MATKLEKLKNALEISNMEFRSARLTVVDILTELKMALVAELESVDPDVVAFADADDDVLDDPLEAVWRTDRGTWRCVVVVRLDGFDHKLPLVFRRSITSDEAWYIDDQSKRWDVFPGQDNEWQMCTMAAEILSNLEAHLESRFVNWLEKGWQ